MVTVVTSEKFGAAGGLTGMPVSFHDLHAEGSFIVLRSVLHLEAIGGPSIKRLGGVLDFSAEVVQYYYRSQRAVSPMMSEYMQLSNVSGATDSEDFTSELERKILMILLVSLGSFFPTQLHPCSYL